MADRGSRREPWSDADQFWDLIGLTSLEREVYEAVLSLAPSELNTTDAEVPTALRRLADLGLIRPASDGWEGLDPTVALVSAARRGQTILDQAHGIAWRLHQDFAANRLRSDPQRLFELVRGPEELAARANMLMTSARSELRTICTPPFVVGPDPVMSDTQVSIMKRGVRVLTLYDSSVLNSPEGLDHMRMITDAGEIARVLPRVRTKLWMVDSEVAMLPLAVSPRTSKPDSVVVAHSAITDALTVLFDLLWAAATPVDFSTGGGGIGRGADRGSRVLSLMAIGMSDATMARQFNVSERTVRRWITELMDRHQVSTRFQLGLVAKDQGLV
ncbi:LuxR C-terminal-related transcriptional regulator [Streptomyces sp. NPDC048278]|uniref:LuxR C-terminal-related transcriptional regulator n=1 Tax=Streptomyces sp. NPDC048278 TaxID=3155809 RepID=UPI00342AD7F0